VGRRGHRRLGGAHDGEIATSLLLDRGAAAARAVQDAADTLRPRLEGTPVVPSFPTPLETELRTT
jgi:hypothetical protein